MELKLRERLDSYIRVLNIAKKPSKDEFFHTAKICAMGAAVVGIVGFLLYIVSILFLG